MQQHQQQELSPKLTRASISRRRSSQMSMLPPKSQALDSDDALNILLSLANAESPQKSHKRPRERSTNIPTPSALQIKPDSSEELSLSGSVGEIQLDDVNAAAIILSRMRGRVGKDHRIDLYLKQMSQHHTYRDRLVQNGIYPIKIARHNYICSHCLAPFPKEVLAWRHGANHLNTKPFECKICGKDFNRFDSLQRHIRKVHNNAINAYFTEDTSSCNSPSSTHV